MNRKERRAEKFGHMSSNRKYHNLPKPPILIFKVAIPFFRGDNDSLFAIEERSMFIAGEIELARLDVKAEVNNYCHEAYIFPYMQEMAKLQLYRSFLFDLAH